MSPHQKQAIAEARNERRQMISNLMAGKTEEKQGINWSALPLNIIIFPLALILFPIGLVMWHVGEPLFGNNN